MYSNVKPEQHVSVTCAKIVAIFQASFKLVEELLLEPNSLTSTINAQYPMDQKNLHESRIL